MLATFTRWTRLGLVLSTYRELPMAVTSELCALHRTGLDRLDLDAAELEGLVPVAALHEMSALAIDDSRVGPSMQTGAAGGRRLGYHR
jgi:hypothetical protein